MISVAKNSFALALGLALATGLLIIGCDSTGGMSGSAEGQFTLNLTDAPADLDSAVVTIDQVLLVSEDAADDDDDGDDDDGDDDGEDDDGDDDDDDGEDEEGIITLTDSTRQIDLLQLQGGVNTTLANVTVPEGEYAQLRLVLGDENYVVVDGERQMLQVPSGKQSGIKIVLPGEVEIENDGDRLEVTLDFDVEESFVETGNGDYIFKPTVKVKEVFVNGESIETVSVDGTVSSASSDVVAVDSIPFAVTEETEFDGDDGASSPSDLQVGQTVEVEGTVGSDGSLEALELEVEDDDEPERSITARIESVSPSDSTLAQLGVTIRVTDRTEFDDDEGLDGLETGERVETDYVFRNGARVATEIEDEDDD